MSRIWSTKSGGVIGAEGVSNLHRGEQIRPPCGLDEQDCVHGSEVCEVGEAS